MRAVRARRASGASASRRALSWARSRAAPAWTMPTPDRVSTAHSLPRPGRVLVAEEEPGHLAAAGLRRPPPDDDHEDDLDRLVGVGLGPEQGRDGIGPVLGEGLPEAPPVGEEDARGPPGGDGPGGCRPRWGRRARHRGGLHRADGLPQGRPEGPQPRRPEPGGQRRQGQLPPVEHAVERKPIDEAVGVQRVDHGPLRGGGADVLCGVGLDPQPPEDRAEEAQPIQQAEAPKHGGAVLGGVPARGVGPLSADRGRPGWFWRSHRAAPNAPRRVPTRRPRPRRPSPGRPTASSAPGAPSAAPSRRRPT